MNNCSKIITATYIACIGLANTMHPFELDKGFEIYRQLQEHQHPTPTRPTEQKCPVKTPELYEPAPELNIW